MALRSLMIELGLADGVSNQLRGIDSQIDGMQCGLAGTQCGFVDLGRATTEYGRVAGTELEGIGRNVTELDKQVEGHADTTAKAADRIANSWGKVGAAIGAAAVGVEAFVRSQQDHYFTADKIGFLTDLDKQEVVGLASELANISNSIDDAYGVMEVGARQGLRTRDELAAYVRVWDDIGTASGENAVDLARDAVSLRSVGIEAGNLTDSYDTLGFVMSHTNSSVSEFLRLTGYMARDMDQYGMEISGVAVLLAGLEEKGMGAADAKRALRTAMGAAKGDTTALYRELGITEEQISRLNEEVAGGAEYIARMGAAYDDAQTPLQYLQVEVGKIGHTLGADLNPILEVGSVAMAGMSSALLMGASAAYLYSTLTTTALLPSLAASTASAWAFTAALLANPITWMVLGIVGLGVALYLLATRWDDISGWFMGRWQATGEAVAGVTDWIGNAWDSTIGRITEGADWLMDRLDVLALFFPFTAPIAGMNLLRDNWDTVTAAIAGGWDWLTGAAQDGAAGLAETIGGGLSGISDLFWQYHPIGIVIRQWDEITGYLEGIDLVETGKDILLGLVDGILDVRGQAIDAVMGVGGDIVESITGFFGIASPSRLMQEMGAAVGEGFTIGVDGSMPDHIRLPDAIEGSIRPGPVRGGYATAWTEPAVGPLAGQITYAPAITEPVVGDLAGVVLYRATVEALPPSVLAGEAVYSSTLMEPTIADLAGTATYLSEVRMPAVPPLLGSVAYEATFTEPFVGDLTGTVRYGALVQEVEPARLAGEVAYQATVADPTISDLAGKVAYQAVVEEAAVSPLAGEVQYSSIFTEPAIGSLTGEVRYASTLTEPSVRDLTGAVTYLATVLEPVVSPLAGTVSYRTAMGEVTPQILAGEARYASILDEPTIADLTGSATYLSQIAPVRVPDLHGTVAYDTTITEPMVADLTGSITYLSTVLEPSIEGLHGTVEYTGVLAHVPDVVSLESQYGVRLPDIDDRVPYSGPERDYREVYTPERDAPYVASERSGDFVYSPTIQVTARSGDANEIATVIDRRLRQTFDRHAETYFARQRRRMG